MKGAKLPWYEVIHLETLLFPILSVTFLSGAVFTGLGCCFPIPLSPPPASFLPLKSAMKETENKVLHNNSALTKQTSRERTTLAKAL